MDAVYPSESELQTKHATLRETPKWQPSFEELPTNPTTNMSHWHHHTLNIHAFHYQKWVHLKYIFRIGSGLNIHPGGEDTLDIYCQIGMY